MRAARSKLIGVIPRLALIHEALEAVAAGGTVRAISEQAMKSAITVAE